MYNYTTMICVDGPCKDKIFFVPDCVDYFYIPSMEDTGRLILKYEYKVCEVYEVKDGITYLANYLRYGDQKGKEYLPYTKHLNWRIR